MRTNIKTNITHVHQSNGSEPRRDKVIEAIAFIGLYPTVTAYIESLPKNFKNDECIRQNMIAHYRELEHIREVGLANGYVDVPPKENGMCVSLITLEVKNHNEYNAK
jgi:hypothetical protein